MVVECQITPFLNEPLFFSDSHIAPLNEQKGFDLFAEIIHDLLKLKIQFILMGEGGAKYRKLFESIKKKYAGKVGINLQFDNTLAHQIIAGSDIFLVPSQYESCGDYHMYGLLYAKIPAARTTGIVP